MKIQATTGQLETTSTDALIVNLFQGVTSPGGATGAVDKALGGAISDLIAQGDLTGKSGEVIVLYPRGSVPAKRVLVAGLGKQADFDAEVASFAAFRRASERPEYRIEKRPALRNRQGMWSLIAEHGVVLRRGHELGPVLAPVERRLLKLVANKD